MVPLLARGARRRRDGTRAHRDLEPRRAAARHGLPRSCRGLVLHRLRARRAGPRAPERRRPAHGRPRFRLVRGSLERGERIDSVHDRARRRLVLGRDPRAPPARVPLRNPARADGARDRPYRLRPRRARSPRHAPVRPEAAVGLPLPGQRRARDAQPRAHDRSQPDRGHRSGARPRGARPSARSALVHGNGRRAARSRARAALGPRRQHAPDRGRRRRGGQPALRASRRLDRLRRVRVRPALLPARRRPDTAGARRGRAAPRRGAGGAVEGADRGGVASGLA